MKNSTAIVVVIGLEGASTESKKSLEKNLQSVVAGTLSGCGSDNDVINPDDVRVIFSRENVEAYSHYPFMLEIGAMHTCGRNEDTVPEMVAAIADSFPERPFVGIELLDSSLSPVVCFPAYFG